MPTGFSRQKLVFASGRRGDPGTVIERLEKDYYEARRSLLQLQNEGKGIGEKVTELIYQLDENYYEVRRRIETSVPLKVALASPLPPAIDRKQLKGMLAYRGWDMKVKGVLSPAVMWSENAWKNEVAYADLPPTRENGHGLHATRIERFRSNSYGRYSESAIVDAEVIGLVDMYGKIVEHADGVLRAECARICMIMIVIENNNALRTMASGVYEAVKWQYPHVPVHMVTEYQKELILWREALANQGAV